MWRSVARLRALPWSRRVLLAQALTALLAARCALAIIPFRRIAAWLGDTEVDGNIPVDAAMASEARDVGWAIGVLAPRLPWDSRCLAQALAGAGMLGRRGIPCTMYLGVQKDPAADFSAHAWLRCGGQWVTGGPGHESFKVIAKFTNKAGGVGDAT